MEKSQDRWHWIESCIALARVNMGKGDMTSRAKISDTGLPHGQRDAIAGAFA